MNEDMHPQQPGELAWRKSTFSQGENDCVEIAADRAGGRWLRDSKNPAGGTVLVPDRAFTSFLAGVTDD